MKIENLVLAADVGGTKTLMCLFDENHGKLQEVRTHKYISCDFRSIEAIIHDFLQQYEVLGMRTFGASGKLNNLLEEFGLTVKAVVKTSKSLIKNKQKELL